MSDKDSRGREEIHSKVLRAGRRTYFFDVRATKADDYYLTITESKKHTSDNGSHYYKKHKIYLYKEDFDKFRDLLNEVTDYIIDEKGSEVISDTHQPDYYDRLDSNNTESEKNEDENVETAEASTSKAFTDVSFEDI